MRRLKTDSFNALNKLLTERYSLLITMVGLEKRASSHDPPPNSWWWWWCVCVCVWGGGGSEKKGSGFVCALTASV